MKTHYTPMFAHPLGGFFELTYLQYSGMISANFNPNFCAVHLFCHFFDQHIPSSFKTKIDIGTGKICPKTPAISKYQVKLT